MSVTEVFLLIIRWLHNIAAITWIGGSLFYWLVLRPNYKKTNSNNDVLNILVIKQFKGFVDTSILVLLVTGIIMTFDRLTDGFIGVPYAATLGIKFLLALWMFYIVLSKRQRLLSTTNSAPNESKSLWQKTGETLVSYNTLVVLGVLVFLLADILRQLVEKALIN